MVLAVVDEGRKSDCPAPGWTELFLQVLSIAQAKAFTAGSRSPTESAASVCPDNLCMVSKMPTGQFCLFGGGIPLFSGTCCIGAIGVSGSTVERDTAVAEVMTQAYQDEHM